MGCLDKRLLDLCLRCRQHTSRGQDPSKDVQLVHRLIRNSELDLSCKCTSAPMSSAAEYTNKNAKNERARKIKQINIKTRKLGKTEQHAKRNTTTAWPTPVMPALRGPIAHDLLSPDVTSSPHKGAGAWRLAASPIAGNIFKSSFLWVITDDYLQSSANSSPGINPWTRLRSRYLFTASALSA